MKHLTKLFLLIVMIGTCATACQKDNIVKGNAALTGRWMDIGGYISNGGPTCWVKATNKSFLQLNADGTMKWDESNDFMKYRLKDSITLKMSNADSTKYEDYFYSVRHDTLILSPSGPVVCIEGCSTYFKKVGSN